MKLPNDPKIQSPNNQSVVFFGSSSYVLLILEVLRKNFDLSLVLTTEKSKPASQGLALQGEALKNLRNLPVINYCVENKIPYLSVQQFNNSIIKQLQELKSPIAVLADFGLIIPQGILNAFPKGIINIHPSLLPKYRGPTPVQNAILNGDKNTGVSIIKLDNEIDHGPILEQEKEEILPTDTANSLYKRLFEKGANLLPKVLNFYLKNELKPIAQNHKEATFTKPLTRQDGFINLSSLKIANCKLQIERMIHAYFPWPGVWTRLHLPSRKDRDGGQAKIVKFLPDNKLQVEGKKPVSYKDFINGYPNLKQIHSLLKNL